MGKKKKIVTTTTTEEIIETNEKTLIVCLLDRSGSMSGVITAAIEKFNEFLHSQQILPDRADMTIALFDDQYELLYENVNVKDVRFITRDQWTPRGMTRLNDAIGKTINTVKRDIQRLNKKDRPDKVLVVITTDGIENDSKEYTSHQVRNLISECEKEEFTFLYLAANQDAFAVGGQYGISKGNTFNFANTTSGNATMYNAVSAAATSYRGISTQSVNYSHMKKSLLTEDNLSGSGISPNNAGDISVTAGNSNLLINSGTNTANLPKTTTKVTTKTEETEEAK